MRMKHMPRGHDRNQSYELRKKVGKLQLPYYDGSGKSTARAWVKKLDTYFQLNPMPEEEAIKYAAIHLDGLAHKWWHHGMVTMGHAHITLYVEFKERLIEHFDRPKDRTFPMTGRNLYEEFNKHTDSIQGDISTSSDSDSSTVGLDEVTAVEDTVMFEDSTVDQKVSIQDFAENEYQAQLDVSSHEIEASSSSLGLASQLKIGDKDIVAALSHHDRMRGLIENHIWMIQLQERQKGVTTSSSCDDLQQIKAWRQ